MSVFVSALIAFSDPLIALAAPSAAITLVHTFAARAALAASEAASAPSICFRAKLLLLNISMVFLCKKLLFLLIMFNSFKKRYSYVFA